MPTRILTTNTLEKRKQGPRGSYHRGKRGWKVCPCLKCDQPFHSFGPSNRLCGPCRKDTTGIATIYPLPRL